MAKAKAAKAEKVPKAKKVKRPGPPLADRLTTWVMVLFLGSLAAPHVVPVALP